MLVHSDTTDTVYDQFEGHTEFVVKGENIFVKWSVRRGLK